MGSDKTGKITLAFVCIFMLFLAVAAWIENAGFQETEAACLQFRITYGTNQNIMYSTFPLLGYAGEEMWEEDVSVTENVLCNELPVLAYLKEKVDMLPASEDEEVVSGFVYEEPDEYITEKNTVEQNNVNPDYYSDMLNENRHAVIFTGDSDFLCAGSGFVSEISAGWITEFAKATTKTKEFDYSQILDYEFVMENFYTVDACTSAGPDVINPKQLLEYDVTIDKTMPGPHILVYHTHSQEAFADSVEGDKSTTIVGAGAKLSQLLREEYGYEVYHHTGEYDLDTRDDAYAKSAPALEEILEQYPQIQVIIDLHRDGVDESRHLVAEWEDKKVAQFMFFNGLSYINTKGPIDYLPNPNLQGNLALSFQATLTANEYYPGLTRRTYLNGYRYNMHYREKTMLIELGAQTNTVDEIMNACEPLAHILDLVFSGKENG